MGIDHNPYAPPSAAASAVAESGELPRRERRVGGGVRVLAALIDGAPVMLVTLALFRLPSRERAIAMMTLGTAVVYITLEILCAASPGMLLLGLRAARAGGRAAPRYKLALKAALVRVPFILHVPANIAFVVGSPLWPNGSAHWPNKSVAILVFAIEFVWALGFLGAFGANRQTTYDRMLKLAVFRKPDVRVG